MRIGVDILALQSEGSRGRGVGRYASSFLKALANADPLADLVLHEHAGRPAADLDGLAFDSIRAVEIDRARGIRTMADAGDRLAIENPDAIDALLVLNPFELDHGYAPPARVPGGPLAFAIAYDFIPFLHQEKYLTDPGHARKLYRAIERLKKYDGLLAISESTRVDGVRLTGMPPGRIATVGSASDPAFFRPDRSIPAPLRDRRGLGRLGIRGPFVFGLAGMDERKGWAELIDAFATLPPRLRQTYQLVLGFAMTSEYAGRVRGHAMSRGVEGRLVLADSVDDVTLRALYQRCSAFVFPSKYEGFGLPILEAMHCGAPVLAGNNSSQFEVVGEAGLLANVEDARDLSANLGRLLEDPILAREIGRKAEAQADLFSWGAVGARASAAIREAVAKASSRGAPGVMRRPRPRVAMFSPWPPKASGISDYSTQLVRAISDRYAVDLYHESGYVPEPALGSGDFASYDARLFPRNARAIGYRGVVYQMGNSFYHRFVYESLLKHPGGIAVIHDYLLAGFQFWHCHQHHDAWARLHDEIRYCEPVRGESIVAAIEDLCREPGGFQEAAARRGLFLNRRVFDLADAVVVHSPWCRDRAAEMGLEYRDKSEVIPLGRDVQDLDPSARGRARERFGLPADSLIFASFGILSQGKMNVEAIEAFAKVAASRPESLFLLVGQDWEDGEARRAADSLGIARRVRFLGRVDAEVFEALLPAADIGVSLRRPPTYGETSAALLDLLRHGVPTVVTDVATFADYPDDVVRKVRWEADGPDGLEAAFRDLAENLGARRRLGKSARRYVAERHSWADSAALYVDLIERIDRARRRGGVRRATAPQLAGV